MIERERKGIIEKLLEIEYEQRGHSELPLIDTGSLPRYPEPPFIDTARIVLEDDRRRRIKEYKESEIARVAFENLRIPLQLKGGWFYDTMIDENGKGIVSGPHYRTF